ncbi:histone-lysine N-methyltransferase SETD1A-like, partial [Scyliorhinus torazame]|uniref:histone-lysine N-methyltransferase SETD1A-like n=1 Tax=Scyliorhinus torazame TaxID=75743 RepID=UPI003B58C4A6
EEDEEEEEGELDASEKEDSEEDEVESDTSSKVDESEEESEPSSGFESSSEEEEEAPDTMDDSTVDSSVAEEKEVKGESLVEPPSTKIEEMPEKEREEELEKEGRKEIREMKESREAKETIHAAKVATGMAEPSTVIPEKPALLPNGEADAKPKDEPEKMAATVEEEKPAGELTAKEEGGPPLVPLRKQPKRVSFSLSEEEEVEEETEGEEEETEDDEPESYPVGPSSRALRRRENLRSISPPAPTTIRNLPLDHAALVKAPTEEPPARASRGRNRQQQPARTPTPEPPEDVSLRLKEQLGASSLLALANTAFSPRTPDKGVDLAALADIALTIGEAGAELALSSDDEEEEDLLPRPERTFHLEHSYAKPPPRLPSPSARRASARRGPGEASRAVPSPLEGSASQRLITELLSDHLDAVLEAPEEVVAPPCPPQSTGVLEVGDLGGGGAGGGVGESRRLKGRDDDEEAHKRRRRLPQEENEEAEEVGNQEDTGPPLEGEEEALPPAGQATKGKRLEPGEVYSERTKAGAEPPDGAFELRSEFEEMSILYDIWNSGLDPEDARYLKQTYEQLLQEDTSVDWLNDTHWVFHTNILHFGGAVGTCRVSRAPSGR